MAWRTIFAQALTSRWGGTVLLIATVGQLFCTMACMTSCTRMLFAFSRDGAVPGHKLWSQAELQAGCRSSGVILVAVIAIILTLPALIKVDINGVPVPVAFFAVVSIGVIGLYWCFAIPIWHRWRMGDSFERGELEPRREVQVALGHRAARHRPGDVHGLHAERQPRRAVGLGLLLEVRELHHPRLPGFLIFLWIYWHVSVKNWFTGPKHTIRRPPGDARIVAALSSGPLQLR